MNKALLLRLHRWITLVFAVPLAVLIVTGLVLSFEPIAVGGGSAVGSISADAVAGMLARHDPQGQARALFMRAYDGTASIAGVPGRSAIHVDLASNAQIASPGALPRLFGTSRQLHETFLLQLGWLVTASTIAMLVLVALGILMGWPRLRNTVAGWHKGTAWVLLPLVVLSPLTGLLLAFGMGMSVAPANVAKPARPLPLVEAVRIVAAGHDLARVTWIRARGSAMLARVDDGGEMRVFAVAPDGLKALPRNWPRLVHEGNWSRLTSAGINIATSIALILLLTTGLVLWGRRSLRPARRRTGGEVRAGAVES